MFELENSYSSTRELRSQVTNLKIALKVTANFVTRCFNTVRENSSSKFEFRNTEITLIDCVRLWRYPLMAPLSHWQSIILTNIKALSGLIRFQTKTELFCSVFKKICVHAYRFRIVFAHPHHNAVSVLETLLYPQCACSKNSTHAHFNTTTREIGAKLMASVRHFEYSRSSGLAPGRVYLMTSPFSDRIVFSVHTRKQRFQKASFSNRSTLGSVFERLRFRWSFSAF